MSAKNQDQSSSRRRSARSKQEDKEGKLSKRVCRNKVGGSNVDAKRETNAEDMFKEELIVALTDFTKFPTDSSRPNSLQVNSNTDLNSAERKTTGGIHDSTVVTSRANAQHVAPPSNLPRKRHADVPRRITYYSALNKTNRELEQICERDFFRVGAMDRICSKCGALFFVNEPTNRAGTRMLCCKDGVVNLPPLSQCPGPLKELFTGDGHLPTEFRRNIRRLNSLFALATFTTTREINEGQGHWCFAIRGQIQHFLEGIPIRDEHVQSPRLSTYYFLDAEEALNIRYAFLGDISRELLETIEQVLRRHHKFIIGYERVSNVLKERKSENANIDNAIICITKDPVVQQQSKTRHRLSEHRNDTVSIFFGEDPSTVQADLIIYPQNRNHPEPKLRHQELKNLSPFTDPFVYPLLFPCGDVGYDMDRKHTNDQSRAVTFNEYYRYRLFIRQDFSIIHNGGKLMQQYVVDAWGKSESNRLWFYKKHQKKFRLAVERSLRGYNDNRRGGNVNETAEVDIGKKFILPASFPGSARDRYRIYQENMCVISRFGKPDLFITFTCNPRWDGIVENLGSHQKFEHRPDLICRVFHTYLREFINDIVEKQVYGIVLNYFYVIEFQKRGLPHAHILVTFRDDNKILEPEDVDRIVHAYIPDRETQPGLFELVKRHQVHASCLTPNRDAPCINPTTGQCSKFFPKNFQNETCLYAGKHKQPLYKRPCDDRTIDLANGNQPINNTRIVSYNPFALAKYNCHINFEVVGTIGTIKYLYKYLDKSLDVAYSQRRANNGDRDANREQGADQDEISKYVRCRSVSSVEAMWRLLEYPLQGHSHSVLTLPVHLPNERHFVFQEDDNFEDIERRLQRCTKLEAWFQLNRIDAQANQYKYVQIPEFYVWENRTTCWKRRKQTSKQIGCTVGVNSIDDSEKYFLSVLLRYVTGATSFEFLRTLDNGVVCDTFKEACVRRNFLRHNDEFDRCLQDASLRRQPGMLRRLFALICCVAIDDSVAQIPSLWKKYKQHFVEDFLHRNYSRKDAITIVIRQIDRILSRNRPDITIDDLGIFAEINDSDAGNNPNDLCGEISDEKDVENVDLLDQRNANVEKTYYDIERLNRDQKNILYRILKSCSIINDFPIKSVDFNKLVKNSSMSSDDREYLTLGQIELIDQEIYTHLGANCGRLFYIDGPGGTGKTYLYNCLIDLLNVNYGKSTIAVAWTGIAANLLINGETCHRAFKVPLEITETSMPGWSSEHRNSKYIKNCPVIIWDEAPMSKKNVVEAINRYLKDITNSNLPMGGKIVIFGGDFRQILPVVFEAGLPAIISSCIKSCSFWPKVKQLRLQQNMRARCQELHSSLGNKTFPNWLIALGDGALPNIKITSVPDAPKDLIRIPFIFLIDTLDALLDFVYDGVFTSADNANKAILCPTNDNVNTVNNLVLDRILNQTSCIYVSVDEYPHADDDLPVTPDLLHSIDMPSLPPHELKLKVGCIVTLVKNLDVTQGQCNGSRFLVVSLANHFIELETINGQHKGEKFYLPKITIRGKSPLLPRDMTRTQYPVKLAYGITINKAQGQTLHKVGVYLERPCFTHGQLYVAFSRVSNIDDIKFYIENKNNQGCFKFRDGTKFTRNVVFRSVLSENHFQSAPIVFDENREECGEQIIDDPVPKKRRLATIKTVNLPSDPLLNMPGPSGLQKPRTTRRRYEYSSSSDSE